MEGEIIVGTVRGTRNGKHVVVRRDGSTIDVAFNGSASPLIGGDVIGQLSYGDFGEARMTLRRSVLDILLEGKTRIFPMGARADLTARLIAKLLARSRSAVMAPGAGVSIERMPVSDDPDLAWAMAAFQPEAERLSIALNVIDVQAVARAPWQQSTLRDLTLPADIEGSRRTMDDLSRLLRSGFHPDCNRMVEQHTGNREISVNFVLPYSPFTGALGFARDAAMMNHATFPAVTMTSGEARRLSSAKQVALALAHSRLGAGAGIQADVEGSPRAAHMAACFADAAAALAFLAAGGRRLAVAEYADLKEASLFHGYDMAAGRLRNGVLAEATHRALRAAAASPVAEGGSAREIVSEAVRIARRTALPSARFAIEERPLSSEAANAQAAADRIGRDLRDASRVEVDGMAASYRRDIAGLVEEHRGNEAAAARLVAFGSVHVPLRMDRVFDEETRSLPSHRDRSVAEASAQVANRDRLANRIRTKAARQDDDAIEFGEPALSF